MAEFKVQFEEDDVGFDAEFTSEDESFSVEFDNTEVVEVVTSDHNKLVNRELENQHPIKSITNLKNTLDNKMGAMSAISNVDIYNMMNGV